MTFMSYINYAHLIQQFHYLHISPPTPHPLQIQTHLCCFHFFFFKAKIALEMLWLRFKITQLIFEKVNDLVEEDKGISPHPN